MTPIIGGAGTVFGPLLGALVVKAFGEGAKLIAGDVPGLDLIAYGAALVLVVAFCAARHHGRHHRRTAVADAPVRPFGAAGAGRRAMAEPLLSVERVSRRFGGLLAVDAASLSAPAGRITA